MMLVEKKEEEIRGIMVISCVSWFVKGKMGSSLIKIRVSEVLT